MAQDFNGLQTMATCMQTDSASCVHADARLTQQLFSTDGWEVQDGAPCFRPVQNANLQLSHNQEAVI
eukprot:355524-Chlamydomonas_euryale.AAC.3